MKKDRERYRTRSRAVIHSRFPCQEVNNGDELSCSSHSSFEVGSLGHRTGCELFRWDTHGFSKDSWGFPAVSFTKHRSVTTHKILCQLSGKLLRGEMFLGGIGMEWGGGRERDREEPREAQQIRPSPLSCTSGYQATGSEVTSDPIITRAYHWEDGNKSRRNQYLSSNDRYFSGKTPRIAGAALFPGTIKICLRWYSNFLILRGVLTQAASLDAFNWCKLCDRFKRHSGRCLDGWPENDSSFSIDWRLQLLFKLVAVKCQRIQPGDLGRKSRHFYNPIKTLTYNRLNWIITDSLIKTNPHGYVIKPQWLFSDASDSKFRQWWIDINSLTKLNIFELNLIGESTSRVIRVLLAIPWYIDWADLTGLIVLFLFVCVLFCFVLLHTPFYSR